MLQGAKRGNPIKIMHPTAALQSCCHHTRPEGCGDGGVYFAKPHRPVMGGGLKRLKQNKAKEMEVQLENEAGAACAEQVGMP